MEEENIYSKADIISILRPIYEQLADKTVTFGQFLDKYFIQAE